MFTILTPCSSTTARPQPSGPARNTTRTTFTPTSSQWTASPPPSPLARVHIRGRRGMRVPARAHTAARPEPSGPARARHVTPTTSSPTSSQWTLSHTPAHWHKLGPACNVTPATSSPTSRQWTTSRYRRRSPRLVCTFTAQPALQPPRLLLPPQVIGCLRWTACAGACIARKLRCLPPVAPAGHSCSDCRTCCAAQQEALAASEADARDFEPVLSTQVWHLRCL